MRLSIAMLAVLITVAAHAQNESADALLARAAERIAQRDFRGAEPLARRRRAARVPRHHRRP